MPTTESLSFPQFLLYCMSFWRLNVLPDNTEENQNKPKQTIEKKPHGDFAQIFPPQWPIKYIFLYVFTHIRQNRITNEPKTIQVHGIWGTASLLVFLLFVAARNFVHKAGHDSFSALPLESG